MWAEYRGLSGLAYMTGDHAAQAGVCGGCAFVNSSSAELCVSTDHVALQRGGIIIDVDPLGDPLVVYDFCR